MRKVIAIIFTALVSAMGAACGAGGGDAGGNGDGGTDPGNLSTTGRDGKLEFTVEDMKCGLNTATDEYGLDYKPNGQYCRADIHIENIGEGAQSIDTAEYYAIGKDGTSTTRRPIFGFTKT